MSLDTLLEAGNRVQECVRDKGFVATFGPDGLAALSSDDVPADQMDLAATALSDCAKEFNPNFAQTMLTGVQVKNLYYRYLDRKTCLEGEGFSVSEPSSEQAFVDAYAAFDDSLWQPDILSQLKSWGESKGVAAAEVFDEVARRCPDPQKFPTLLN